MPTPLTSSNNPRLKQINSLREASYRKQSNLFIVEGYRELILALGSNIEIVEIYICRELLKPGLEKEIFQEAQDKGIKVILLSQLVYSKVAFGNRQEGLIALSRQPRRVLDKLPLTPNPFLIVVDHIEKPGNLGAIIRTADAAGVDAVIVSDPATDIYNPNVVRSSLGAVFTTFVVAAPAQEAVTWLKKNNICVILACVRARAVYTAIDFRRPLAIVLGSEKKGLSSFWQGNADEQMYIPMRGKADSLNVSVAAAILLFEARRQRSL